MEQTHQPNLMATTLRHLMLQCGIVNSSQLYRSTGITVPTIDRILSGSSINPNTNTLNTLAKFFNVTISQLKGIVEPPVYKTMCEDIKIPVIEIDDINLWLDTFNIKLATKYIINNECANVNPKFFYIVENYNNKTVTYLINPEIQPKVGDTVIISENNAIKIVKFFNRFSLITLDYEIISIADTHKFLGVVIQEIHTRIY